MGGTKQNGWHQIERELVLLGGSGQNGSCARLVVRMVAPRRDDVVDP